MRLQVYGHVLARSADVVEWVQGHVADPLPAAPAARRCSSAFVDEYRRRLLEAIGDTAPYFYPFQRILFWATQAAC